MYSKITLALICFLQLSFLTFSQENNGTLDISMLNSRRIVAVGEATHGSHQEQVFKANLIKRLVQESGYNTILLEASYGAVLPMNSYIQRDSAFDIRNEMVNDYRLYWIWKTDEYVDLLDWLKSYNKISNTKVKIIGIDIDDNSRKDRDSLMSVNVAQQIAEDKRIKAILLAHNGHVANDYRYNSVRSMGMYLKNMFGQDYFTIGQQFGKGSFNVFITNTSVFDTSFVDHYANSLNKKLSNSEKGNILLTKDNKHLNKVTDMWMYGATVPDIGYKYVRKINPVIHFDAIVFHDSISSASNLMRNGNCFVQSTYVVQADNLVNGDTLTFKLSYSTTCNSLVEVQLYSNGVFYKSFVDTLFVDKKFLLRKIGLNAEIDRVNVNVFLFSNGSLSVQSSSIICNESRQISNNIFEESNNRTIPISANSKLELTMNYDGSQVRMLRKNRFGN